MFANALGGIIAVIRVNSGAPNIGGIGSIGLCDPALQFFQCHMNLSQHDWMYSLPSDSFVPLRTVRLKAPTVLWAKSSDIADALSRNGIYCLPQPYESAALYDDAWSRDELVDRYGGAGTGKAGGSGRCSIFEGLQIKGVGRTPLVDPNGDLYHSSGTTTIEESCQEAIFSEIYRFCLPFGAVESMAVVLTGGRFVQTFPDSTTAVRRRALIVRPFVLRPAHFLRNVQFNSAATTVQSRAVGLTADAYRASRALASLPGALALNVGLATLQGSDIDTLLCGLQELGSRYAHQVAASFAKRLPHGALTCSNLALNGAYLDFGVTSHVPDYRRLARRPEWTDQWLEQRAPLRTLNWLWTQYFSHCVDNGNAARMKEFRIVEKHYQAQYQRRLVVEMIKMTGLTEDMARECPAEIAGALVRAMRKTWMRGAHESFSSFPASEIERSRNPPPRSVGRYRLNDILSALACATAGVQWGQVTAAHIDDTNLCTEFANAYSQFRHWVAQHVGDDRKNALNLFMRLQGMRKNSPLEGLRRATLQTELREHELADHFVASAYIDEKVKAARYVLSDLHPELSGATGIDQINSLMNQSNLGAGIFSTGRLQAA